MKVLPPESRLFEKKTKKFQKSVKGQMCFDYRNACFVAKPHGFRNTGRKRSMSTPVTPHDIYVHT